MQIYETCPALIYSDGNTLQEEFTVIEEVPEIIDDTSISFLAEKTTKYYEALRSNSEYIPENYLSNISRKIMKMEASWDGIDCANSARARTRAYLSLFYKCVADKYNLKDLNVLEIGSGAIKFNFETQKDESYLSHYIPHHSWIFSDFCHSLKNCSEQFIPLDLLNLSQKIDGNFNCIVGNNVLDTFDYDQLPFVFQKFSQILKPNDICVHFADLSFLGNTFFQAAFKNNQDCILFPSKKSRQIYKIKKIDYQRILAEKSKFLSKEECELLSLWGSMESRIQRIVAFKLNFGVSADERFKLQEKIINIFSGCIEIIDRNFFPTILKKAAENNGFTVELCEFINTSNMLEEEGPGHNYLEIELGCKNTYFCYVLRPGVRIKSVINHAFVARKI